MCRKSSFDTGHESDSTPNRNSRCGPKRGFTLIELLVVISIISLLAAILFPVFNQVREKAKQTSCMSNMRQIGLALTMYANDKGEGFPPFVVGQNVALLDASYDTNLVSKPGQVPATVPAEKFAVSMYGCKPQHFVTWMDCLFPYIKSIEAFTCPSHPNKLIDIYNPDSPVGDPETWALLDNGKYQLPSLGYVSGFSNIYGSIGGYPSYPFNVPGYQVGVPVKQAMIQDASQKIFLIHEYYLYSHTTASNYVQRSPDSYAASSAGSRNVQRRMWPHNDGAPQIFADGHVKWLSRASAVKWGCGDITTNPYNGLPFDRLRQCWYFEPHIKVPGS